MNPLVLTLDQGNSTLDCVLYQDAVLRHHSLPSANLEVLAAFLQDARPDLAAASTVIPGGLQAVEHFLAARGVHLHLAGRDLPCPLALSYQEPQTLGSDRWLGALAAHRRYGDCVVVDCGTALTINLVDGDGLFLGGAIAP